MVKEKVACCPEITGKYRHNVGETVRHLTVDDKGFKIRSMVMTTDAIQHRLGCGKILRHRIGNAVILEAADTSKPINMLGLHGTVIVCGEDGSKLTHIKQTTERLIKRWVIEQRKRSNQDGTTHH